MPIDAANCLRRCCRPAAFVQEPPFPVDHLQLGQAQQVARIVDALTSALAGQLVVLTQEGRQPQGLQVMCE